LNANWNNNLYKNGLVKQSADNSNTLKQVSTEGINRGYFGSLKNANKMDGVLIKPNDKNTIKK
jgi:hypothetical protein